MAGSTKSKTRRSGENETNFWLRPEILGTLMTFVGVIALLSLMSYQPEDVPLWTGSNPNDEMSSPSRNWIGVVGALIAWLVLITCGAAGYFVPAGMIWIGLGLLFFKAKFGLRTVLAFVVLILSGAGLLDVQSLALHGWVDRLQLPGAGGAFGHLLGSKFLVKFFNVPGSVLIFSLLYLISAILVTGVHPLSFAKGSWIRLGELKTSFGEFLAKRKEARAAKAKAASRRRGSTLPIKPLSNAREIKEGDSGEKEESKSASKSTAKAKPKEDDQAQLPLKEIPKPKIIDSSQNRKRSEMGERPTHAGLSTDGFEGYKLPGFDLLDYDESEPETEADQQELLATQSCIVETLKAFGIEVSAGDITRGPTITRYEIYPSIGLRVSKITALEADLARATKAERINILAPIPGKDTVGIEIANDNKVAVPLRELIQDKEFWSSKKRIPLALGKDVYGNSVIADLAAMPHLLVAGATGSGKSVCINSIITSILFKFRPDELRFIMVDPKVVEMQMYSKLPHLVVPVVTDPKKTVAALRWCVNEMERRYKIFARVGVRNFDGYNSRPRPDKEEVATEEPVEEAEEMDPDQVESIAKAFEDGELGPPEEIDGIDENDAADELGLETDTDLEPDRFPYIVIIIDELADLMQTAPADIEMNIARIAQKARAAGIHLIVATQTPRADVVTGIIKANIPSRIAFQVSSALDSRVILDTKGAEKLVGKGDMLYLPPGSAKLERSQGAFVSDEEVERLVEHCGEHGEQKFEEAVQESIEKGGAAGSGGEETSDEDLDMMEKCIEVIKQENRASTSLLQRRLRLGYTRAARMMDLLEERGVIGPGDGAKPREILIAVNEE